MKLQNIITQDTVDLVQEDIGSIGNYSMQANQVFDSLLQDFGRKYDAARRALGLVNKLSGDSRKKHASRVMTLMNSFRKDIAAIEKQLAAMTQEPVDPQANS